MPLTARGRRQAHDASERLAALVDAAHTLLWSSDQVRALDTARIIGRRLGVAVATSELLREQGLGAMEGCLTSDLHPEPVPEGQHISEVSWQGSETIAACHERARRLVARLDAEVRRTAAPDVVLVTHGTFAAVLLAVLDARSHREVDWDHPLGNGDITVRDLGRRDTGPHATP